MPVNTPQPSLDEATFAASELADSAFVPSRRALHRAPKKTPMVGSLRALSAAGLGAALVATVGVAANAFGVGGTGANSAADAVLPASGDAAASATDLEAARDLWAQASRSDARVSLEVGPEVTFTAVVDGAAQEITSRADTLAQALSDAGIVIGLDDTVSAEMGAAPQQGQQVEVTRVGTRTERVAEEIAFETQRKETATLPKGTEKVQTAGQVGSRETTYVVTYSGGAETSRDLLTEVVVAQPVTEVILVGTADPTPVATTPSKTTPSKTPSSSGGGGSSEDTAPPPAYTGGDPRAIAQQMVAARGWGDDQWQCLNKLWQKESNWNPSARNKSSGAYGIPQSLPGNKMASAGADWRTNPATQITWGLNYISGRYGTPCGAWSHSVAKNWY